ncbi:MAG TPA: transcription antitermination factor NusB [Byssovorax sp.]
MGARTSGREAALQMLFALEGNDAALERTIAWFWRVAASDAAETALTPDARAYADRIVRGVSEDLAKVEEIVRAASTNWRIERMARVDRNVLRLGAYEILYTDTPGRAAINEAVELAKRFGSANSAPFVNGILDKFLKRDPA